MEEISQQPYPSMLGNLEPAQSVQVLNERVKRMQKLNNEVADWLQDRKKVEEAYVQGLLKLTSKPLPGSNSELGTFTAPWQKIVLSAESIAQSHQAFAAKIPEVMGPLRLFSADGDTMSMVTVQKNLSTLLKDLTDAQEKSDKLSKKGAKASTQKVEAATTSLESATSTWESQTPFIFEKLQSLDERRWNTLRDLLTQYGTDESDCISRNNTAVASAIGALIEFNTKDEVTNWVGNVTMGKQKRERQATGSLSGPGRRTLESSGGSQPHMMSSTSNGPSMDDTASEQSRRNTNDGASDEPSSAFNLKKSRFGTMLNKRRQSIVGSTFGRTQSPNTGFSQFGGRGSSSRDGPSPRSSSTNLQDSSNLHLSPLPESPISPNSIQNNGSLAPGNTNGTQMPERVFGSANPYGHSPDLSDVKPPPGPPPSHFKNAQSNAETEKDSEGFTVPPAASDPISQAEQDAANEAREQQFKLAIQSEPIKEEDGDAQAALSNVANTLRGNSSLATPNRKAGTVRGRRDVRNTVYVPAGSGFDIMNPNTHGVIPPSPNLPIGVGTQHTLPIGVGIGTPQASDLSHFSDAQSIRSTRSTGANGIVKHPDMHRPGLNASIVEVLASTFENGQVTSSNVMGDIAFVFNPELSATTPPATETTIRFRNFPALESIGPNHAFVKEISRGDYVLTLEALMKPTAVSSFKYRVHVDNDNMASLQPLLVQSAWKTIDHKLGLVLEYKLNPAFSDEPVTFSNLGFVVTYQGHKASGCQTRPSGVHVRDRQTVYWRLGDVTLNPGDEGWQKLVARLAGTEDAEPQPGTIESRWEITNSSENTGSKLGILQLGPDVKGKGKALAEEEDDPFADSTQPVVEENGGQPAHWVEVETSRKLIMSKYEVK